jgi:hypothetical protein
MRMIKKLSLTMLIVFLMLPTVVFAAPTEKLTVSTYCELYMQRLDKFQKDYNFDLGITVYEAIDPYKVNGGIAIESASGSITVDPNDMSVKEVLFTVNELNGTNEDNVKYERSFIAALSALEFDSTDDATFEMNKIAGKTPSGSIEAAYTIFSETILPAFNSDNLTKANAGDEILIYSGNYDYRMLCHTASMPDGTKKTYYYINAVAR